MRGWMALVLVALGGCDALFGLDKLHGGTVVDAPRPESDGRAIDDAPRDPRLIARFDFEGDFADSVSGQLATCVVGTATCPTFKAGPHGQAVQFDGGNNCLQFPLPTNPAHVTVAAWINRGDDAGRTVVAKQYGVSNFDSWQMDTESNLQARFITYDGTAEKILTMVGGLQTNWQHVAMTFDGTNKLIYVNGASLPAVATAETIVSGGSAMYIGCDRNGSVSARMFLGAIDEVVVYSEALGTGEIAALAAP